jgi:hypothetical protein
MVRRHEPIRLVVSYSGASINGHYSAQERFCRSAKLTERVWEMTNITTLALFFGTVFEFTPLYHRLHTTSKGGCETSGLTKNCFAIAITLTKVRKYVVVPVDSKQKDITHERAQIKEY